MKKIVFLNVFVGLLGFCAVSQVNSDAFFKTLDTIKNRELIISKLQNFKLRNSLNDKEKAEYYRRIILAAIESQKYDLSLKYSFQAEKFARKIKNDSLQCYFTNQIGGSYYYIYKKEEAKKYFEKSIRLAHQKNLWELEAKTLSNLGVIYLENSDFKNAEPLFKKSISVFKEHEEHHKQGLLPYRLLATLYTNSKQFEKAKPIFTKIIQISKQIKDTSNICSSLIYYAQFLSDQGLNKEALNYSEEALKLQRTQHDKKDLVNTLSYLGSHYTKNGQHEQAAKVYEEMINLNIEIFKHNLEKGIAEVEVKYKTSEIRRLKELAESRALAEQRKKNQYLFVSIGIFLLLIIVFLLLYLKQQSKRRQHESALQKVHLQAIIQAQEEEKVRIARDLHDGICQKFAATKMKFSAISKGLLDNLPEIESNYTACVNLLDEATNELRGIAHDIMPPALNELGLDEALKQLSSQSFAQQINYTFEVFGSSYRMDQNVNINIYRIAQELFANILKHAGASEVSVQLLYSGKQLILHVEDNGCGFVLDTKPGMGLGNMQLRAEIIQAKFNIEPGVNCGSVATLIVTKSV